jgi:hypothetical protein
MARLHVSHHQQQPKFMRLQYLQIIVAADCAPLLFVGIIISHFQQFLRRYLQADQHALVHHLQNLMTAAL